MGILPAKWLEHGTADATSAGFKIPPKVPINYMSHREDREDIPIIILDTKLVPDFVLHACYFFIAGNRPVLMPLNRTNKSLTYENRAAKS